MPQLILIIDENSYLAEEYAGYLLSESYEVRIARSVAMAAHVMEQTYPDAVIMDFDIADEQNVSVLAAVPVPIRPAVYIMTANRGTVDGAVRAMRDGAADFLVKPFKPQRLIEAVKSALNDHVVPTINRSYSGSQPRKSYLDFIGASDAMQSMYRLIDSASQSRATVFITGESGTGKDVCAETLHQMSPRSMGPFTAINCGAILRNLMESHIFGHRKGAFTDAVTDQMGAAAYSHGGTLFLDEVCELELSLQAKLLRFVQTGEFQPIGSTSAQQVDVRFVFATNKDPLTEVKAGRFREYLFYRLHVIPVHLPPLRTRGDDVMEIARHYLGEFSVLENKNFVTFTSDCQDVIREYEWPGNVRQLQNVIRTAVVLNDGPELSVAMLPDMVTSSRSGNVTTGDQRLNQTTEQDSNFRSLRDVQHDAIAEALESTGDNVALAARLLEISPATLYRRIKEMNS